MSCCPPGSIGASAGSVPDAKGSWRSYEVGDGAPPLDVYVTGTPTSERAIVVFSDVFGPRYGFHRSICDELADRTSSFVLMPDLFRRDPPAKMPTTSAGKWWVKCLNKLPWWIAGTLTLPAIVYRLRYYWNWEQAQKGKEGSIYNRVGADVEALLDQVSSDHASVCAAGFCFGGYVIFKAAATGKLKGIVGFHPSPSVGRVQRDNPESERRLAKLVRCPVLLLPASNDPGSVKPGGTVMATLKEGEHGERSQSIEFKNVIHGFMTRSVDDPTFDASVADDRKRALTLAVDFIKESCS